MRVSIDDPAMLQWLRQQVHVLSAWQVELLLRETADEQALEGLDAQRAWLESEVDRLETRPGGPRFQA